MASKGFTVRRGYLGSGNRSKQDDAYLISEVVETVCMQPGPSTVILVAGDADYVPPLIKAQDRHWRNEVAFIDRGISIALEAYVHEFRTMSARSLQLLKGNVAAGHSCDIPRHYNRRIPVHLQGIIDEADAPAKPDMLTLALANELVAMPVESIAPEVCDSSVAIRDAQPEVDMSKPPLLREVRLPLARVEGGAVLLLVSRNRRPIRKEGRIAA